MERPTSGETTIQSSGKWANRCFKLMLLLGLLTHLIWSVLNGSQKSRAWLEVFSSGQGVDWSYMTNSLQSITSGYLESETVIRTARPGTLFSGNQNEFQDMQAPRFYERIPLKDLIYTAPDPICKSPLVLAKSIMLNETLTHPSNRKIPKQIHMASRTRCLTPNLYQAIQQWQWEGYSFYLHDEEAIDRLLTKFHPAFPHLPIIQECIASGASKIDLWRMLVLWEYGGIYADLDSLPGPNLEQGNAIQDEDEAFFVVNDWKILSTSFVAAAPKHPFVHINLNIGLTRLMDVLDIGHQKVHKVTGHNATKDAFIAYVSDNTGKYNEQILAGFYRGPASTSIKVVGTRRKTQEWLVHSSDPSTKKEDYDAMGMIHFSNVAALNQTQDSCYRHLYKRYQARIKPTSG